MHRGRFLVALLLAACGSSTSKPSVDAGHAPNGGADVGCSCAEPGKLRLEICSAGLAQVDAVTTSGTCAGTSLDVALTGEGECSFTLHFKDGSEQSKTVTVVRYSGSCCPGLYTDPFFVGVPAPGCPAGCGTPDAGC